MENYSSKHLEQAVNELSKLPGIGKKTALRLALHLLKQDKDTVDLLSKSLVSLKEEVHFCKRCHNISDQDYCEICQNLKRDRSLICVVEDFNDVIAIEKTSQYRGLYHVLGGVISPMEGIGPNELNIDSLAKRVKNEETVEVILALPSTIEGDTTSFYISKQIKQFEILLTVIARGINIGDEIEYADEVTLGRSIINRLPYHENPGS